MRKSDQSRQFAPDYVSAETLAYRLDCSERTVQDYVKTGLLPHPIKIGNLVRWYWPDVESYISAMNGAGHAKRDDATAAIEAARQERQKAHDRAA